MPYNICEASQTRSIDIEFSTKLDKKNNVDTLVLRYSKIVIR